MCIKTSLKTKTFQIKVKHYLMQQDAAERTNYQNMRTVPWQKGQNNTTCSSRLMTLFAL